MGVEILTKEDLWAFKNELIGEVKVLLSKDSPTSHTKWLRSAQVRKLLSISPGTLQQMRISGDLKYTKVGSIHFYRYSDVEAMLSKNKS